MASPENTSEEPNEQDVLSAVAPWQVIEGLEYQLTRERARYARLHDKYQAAIQQVALMREQCLERQEALKQLQEDYQHHNRFARLDDALISERLAVITAPHRN